jgi:hypothetical protein
LDQWINQPKTIFSLYQNPVTLSIKNCKNNSKTAKKIMLDIYRQTLLRIEDKGNSFLDSFGTLR